MLRRLRRLWGSVRLGQALRSFPQLTAAHIFAGLSNRRTPLETLIGFPESLGENHLNIARQARAWFASHVQLMSGDCFYAKIRVKRHVKNQ